jgi:hypothetical protein
MRPTIVEELIRTNNGWDEGELVEALWELYLAVRDDHSGRHFESECPQCIAIKSIERLSADIEI